MLHPESLRRRREQAQWKVKFLRSLLETNRNFVFNLPGREKKAKDLLIRLSDAEAELERLQAEEASSSEGRRGQSGPWFRT